MEYENKYATKGVANTALGLGIGAIATELLGGNLGGILGNRSGTCSDDHCVNRYEMRMQQELAAKDAKIALLESNIYVDGKISDVYERLNNKITCIEGQIAQQAVYNATMNGTVSFLSAQIAQLQSLTKIVVPNSSVCPGWGNVTITPEATTTA